MREARLKPYGWSVERRVVIARQRIRRGRHLRHADERALALRGGTDRR
jgi:hypothetical protein